MTARILVVDDVEANVRLLEAKLTLEYYEVLTASDGATEAPGTRARATGQQERWRKDLEICAGARGDH